MNETTGFLYFTATILCVVASPAALYKSVKTHRLFPGIIGCVLAGVAIFCSLPFRGTYEMPWLPGIVILFFIAVAYVSIRSIVTRESGSQSTESNHRVRFGLRSMLAAMLLCCLAFYWVAVCNNLRDKRHIALVKVSEHNPTTISDRGMLSFDDKDMTDDDIPQLIPGLLEYPFTLTSIDLSRTSVTDVGVEKLDLALPGCNVYR